MSLMEAAPKRLGGFSLEGARAMRANKVYDKLAFLVGITVVSAVVTMPMVSRSTSLQKLIVPAMLIALGCSLAGTFKPALAQKVAPVYALLQGVVLGAISKAYATAVSSSIVPMAIVATAAIFVGCLVVFRSGLVKVTPKFVGMISIASIALFACYMASFLGLNIPGIRDIGGGKAMIFGVIGLAIGIGALFIDFDRVQKMETGESMSNSVEWYLAFQLLLSLVMVYLNVLRILASSQSRR
jgi:uncharacterized YccA/Bax inhibitor family protein